MASTTSAISHISLILSAPRLPTLPPTKTPRLSPLHCFARANSHAKVKWLLEAALGFEADCAVCFLGVIQGFHVTAPVDGAAADAETWYSLHLLAIE